jgi:hypothetical protein
MTLTSRTFARQDDLQELLEHVKSVFAERIVADDLELEVLVRHKRPRKGVAVEAMPKDAEDWAEDGYEFRFSQRRYSWKGLTLHVTAGEALFLYRWLVEGSFNASEKYYLHNLRKRYGSEFLADRQKNGGKHGQQS